MPNKGQSLGVIDYGTGNLRSVVKAFEYLGADVQILQKPDKLSNVDALIFPGQGTFDQCMEALNRTGFSQAIKEWILCEKPFLGICLGLQVLFEKSEEGKTIIFSTHQMEQVERLCSNISLINKGKIVLDGKLKTIKESRKTKAIEVVFNGKLDKEKIKTFLENILIKENFISGNVKKDVHVFLNWINKAVQVESFQVKIPTLEQIFIDEMRKSS